LPDTAKIKDKVIFISSKDALKGSLDGIAVEVQGGDPADIVSGKLPIILQMLWFMHG
jgi:hypothetical protein